MVIVWFTGLLELLLVLPARIYQVLSDLPIFGSLIAPALLWLRMLLPFVFIAAI
jgi:hypothetical protein